MFAPATTPREVCIALRAARRCPSYCRYAFTLDGMPHPMPTLFVCLQEIVVVLFTFIAWYNGVACNSRRRATARLCMAVYHATYARRAVQHAAGKKCRYGRTAQQRTAGSRMLVQRASPKTRIRLNARQCCACPEWRRFFQYGALPL